MIRLVFSKYQNSLYVFIRLLYQDFEKKINESKRNERLRQEKEEAIDFLQYKQNKKFRLKSILMEKAASFKLLKSIHKVASSQNLEKPLDNIEEVELRKIDSILKGRDDRLNKINYSGAKVQLSQILNSLNSINKSNFNDEELEYNTQSYKKKKDPFSNLKSKICVSQEVQVDSEDINRIMFLQKKLSAQLESKIEEVKTLQFLLSNNIMKSKEDEIKIQKLERDIRVLEDVCVGKNEASRAVLNFREKVSNLEDQLRELDAKIRKKKSKIADLKSQIYTLKISSQGSGSEAFSREAIKRRKVSEENIEGDSRDKIQSMYLEINSKDKKIKSLLQRVSGLEMENRGYLQKLTGNDQKARISYFDRSIPPSKIEKEDKGVQVFLLPISGVLEENQQYLKRKNNTVSPNKSRRGKRFNKSMKTILNFEDVESKNTKKKKNEIKEQEFELDKQNQFKRQRKYRNATMIQNNERRKSISRDQFPVDRRKRSSLNALGQKFNSRTSLSYVHNSVEESNNQVKRNSILGSRKRSMTQISKTSIIEKSLPSIYEDPINIINQFSEDEKLSECNELSNSRSENDIRENIQKIAKQERIKRNSKSYIQHNNDSNNQENISTIKEIKSNESNMFDFLVPLDQKKGILKKTSIKIHQPEPKSEEECLIIQRLAILSDDPNSVFERLGETTPEEMNSLGKSLSKEEVPLGKKEFKHWFKKVVESHSLCGPLCPHLQRFFERLKMLNVKNNGGVAMLHTRLLNKLPISKNIMGV